jgi:hypothetical protein
MWLVSLLVLLPIFFLVGGGNLPQPVLSWLEGVIQNDAAPSERVVAISFAVGLAVSGTPLHLFGRYLVTLVHELGHAFVAGVLGGRPQHITVSLNTSGLAYSNPPENWGRFRILLVCLAGYLAPPVAALAAVRATLLGLPRSWFAYAVATLAIAIVFLVRNIWGFLWTALAVTGSYFAAKYLSVEIVAASVPGFAGYLALEGLRDARLQQKIVRYSPGSGCDAEKVAWVLRISPRFAAAIHFFAILGISAYATYLAVWPYRVEISNWVEEFIIEAVRQRL